MRIASRFRVVGAVLVATALCLAACSPPQAAPHAASGNGQASQASSTPIKIGYMADANGTSAPIAAGMHLGTDLAVQQVNAAGGLNGHPLQVMYVDPQSDPTHASQMATQLIHTDTVNVPLGPAPTSQYPTTHQLMAK